MKIIPVKVLAIVVMFVTVTAFSLLPTFPAQDYSRAYQMANTAQASSALTLLASTSNYNITYQLANKPGGDVTYQLHVSIPESLVQYYNGLSHQLSTPSDFSKFVTPYALKPIADRLWQIYNNQEDFANGVLMIVHQITYQATIPGKYPVETMTDGEGDCDLFSYIAASILIAGGFNTVLFYYESQEHMEIGVSLNNVPTEIRGGTYYYVNYNNTHYYIGECTGGNWQEGWRIGECPDDYKSASSQVITLQDTSQVVAPGQVSASYNTMKLSTLSLGTNFVLIQDNYFTLNGQIGPVLKNQNVTLYVKINDSEWIKIGTTSTQINGEFNYTWKPTSSGFYTFLASWSGNDTYAGATSSTIYAIVIPWYLIAAGLLLLAGGISALIYYILKRRRRHQINPETISDNANPYNYTI